MYTIKRHDYIDLYFFWWSGLFIDYLFFLWGAWFGRLGTVEGLGSLVGLPSYARSNHSKFLLRSRKKHIFWKRKKRKILILKNIFAHFQKIFFLRKQKTWENFWITMSMWNFVRNPFFASINATEHFWRPKTISEKSSNIDKKSQLFRLCW